MILQYSPDTISSLLVAGLDLAARLLGGQGLTTLAWRITPILLALGGSLAAMAAYHLHSTDRPPAARQPVPGHGQDGVVVVSKGRIVDANATARRLLGIDEEPATVRSPRWAAMASELADHVLAIVRSTNGSVSERSVAVQGPAGPLVFSLTATPLPSGQNGSARYVVVLRENSARPGSQQPLEALYARAEAARRQLALTIAAVNDAVVLLDDCGNVVESNRAANILLPPAGKSAYPPALIAVLDEAAGSARLAQVEVDIGEKCFHASAMPAPGTGTVLTLHDITDFKRLALIKDDFVAAVSHDLRAPLTSIMGYTDIVQQGQVPEETYRSALQRIQLSARRMAELITDLLNLAKLEASRGRESVPVDLAVMARTAGQTLEGAALAKGLSLDYDVQTHAPVMGDPRLLRQMWRNLIDNAIKYTERGSVTVRVVELDDLVVAQVIDTGMGIPPADLPYVFDKFYRGRRAIDEDADGTGLGLALVKSIVDRHDGRVWVESELGAGTTFTVLFPRANILTQG